MIRIRNAFVAILSLVALAHAQQRVVSVYCSQDEEFATKILHEFEADTGIHVRATFDTENTKTVALYRKLLNQKGDPQADVYWNNEIANTIRLKDHGVLEPYVSPQAAGIPARFKDPDGYWTGFAARARILIVNTKLVPPDKMPHGMWDFTKAEWRGKTCMAMPETGTTATHAVALYVVLGQSEADRYFHALVDNDIHFLTGNSYTAREVAAGNFAFGWTDTDDFNVQLQKGMPVAKVYPDTGKDDIGDLVLPNTLMLIKNCPHPQEGKRLIDYLLRPETEAELARSSSVQIPVRPGVSAPPDVKRLDQIGKTMDVDWDTLGHEYQGWVAHVRNLLVGSERSAPTLMWVIAGVLAIALLAGAILRHATREPT